jgi:uncharacterized protein YndB with AHSA1/START domain
MVRQEITIAAPPDEVFAVLLDGYAYADWVVGARRVRGVDPTWPAVGARFHHALGVGPAELKDSSEILEVDAPTTWPSRSASAPSVSAAWTCTSKRCGAGGRPW